ncbi:MAG TPA: GNAT family protein [bacterium]|nr:GNAT family protein [bacterium]
MAGPTILIRDIIPADFDILFEHQRDPEANRMAAFTARDPEDRAAFDARMGRILADPAIVKKCIEVDGHVTGNVMSWVNGEHREVCYWIDRAYWGRGIATAALQALLAEIQERPLYAGVAADNAASIRVLEKCGFVIESQARGFANARGMEIDEYVMRLA